ncbi:MAG: hypothetical protein MJ089_04760 [Ruminococcus sp.]|nr:hypothetical protein [Ruminococcus sp.]
MFKKIASILFAASLIAGSTAAVCAAETTEDAVAADSSSEISADSSSEVGSTDGIFYFDVASCGWKDYADANPKKIYCHVFAYSESPKDSWTAWQSKGEVCTYDSATGIATYDIQTGIKKGADSLNSLTADSKYLIMFSTGAGAETYPILMNTGCYGDTVVSIGEEYENNVDSEKKSIATKWKNNNLGAATTITSTGKIQGTSLAYGETNATVMAAYLVSYYNDADKLAIAQDLVNKLKVSLTDVMAASANKIQAQLSADKITSDDAKAMNDAIVKTLAGLTDPTTGNKVDEKEINDAKDKGTEDSKNGVSAGDSSSKTTSSSSNSTSKSTTSSTTTASKSVSSGQDTTVFFVFGGVMVAAAGVIFLLRKKEA